MTENDAGQDRGDESVAYPYWLRTEMERRRFDRAVEIAVEVMDAPHTSAAVWSAARVIYQMDDMPE